MSHRRDGSLREVIGQRAGRYGRASTVRPGRHPEDRSILLLAAPALGALAADPLYSLIDTAFVGHLGPRPLAAVAIGNTAFTASFWIFSFLAYGVTPRVARAFGAGKGRDAATVGAQALLLALLLGGLVTVAGVVLAGPVVGALGAGAGVARLAEPYLRVRVLSAIPVLVAQVGHGWLRGAQDTRTPSYIALGGLAAGTVLDFLLIYPAGLGVMGAAWATFIAQGLVGACFTVVLLRRMEPVPLRVRPSVLGSLLSIGADLVVRSGSLLAAMTAATAVAARMGVLALGSWQIAMQVMLFLALTLDTVAIAGQALVGSRLGQCAPEAARHVSGRLLYWGLTLGIALAVPLLVLRAPVSHLFTGAPGLLAHTLPLMAWVALVQPLSAIAYTLDGILIGATDTRFLALSMALSSALYVALAVTALKLGWGTAGLAAGATVWLLARVVTTGGRFLGTGWLAR